MTCDYCGLPSTGPYCCFGCRFAAEVTRGRGAEGAATWALTRLGIALFLTMNVTVFTMALWTPDLYGPDDAGAVTASLRGVFRHLALLLSLPVLFLLGGPLAQNAWDGLLRGVFATDLLLVVGVVASYAFSAVSVLRDDGPVYFEVGCFVLVFVTLGRWLEATGKLKTTAALEALHKLLPETARVVADKEEKTVPLSEVHIGDLVRVAAGERLPCDGRIVSGSAAVDEQVLTGESQPALKGVGDRVHGGTLNLDGDLIVETMSPPSGGALARLIALVREARLAKGRYERLADRLSAYFLPLVVAIAVAAGAWHGWHDSPEAGVLVGLAVLLIACPCALGLATPMAVWTALGRAAQAQVLFRDGEALERFAAVVAVRLDKTGTLTTGTPQIDHWEIAEETDAGAALTLAASLASSSGHCHCQALRSHLSDVPTIPFFDVRTIAGRGLSARRTPDGEPVLLGSAAWLTASGQAFGARLGDAVLQARKDGRAMTCLGWGECARAVFVLRETLRPEAAAAVAELRAAGLDVAILTGDHADRGRALGAELGLPVEADLMPEDKVAAVARARRDVGPTAMVGDGINDAPALAAADIGVALGCGTDVARDAAAVCLLGDDLRRLPWAISLARRTVAVVRGNLFWALVYNVVGVGIACTGRLNPVLASLAMVLSSLFVVSNSLRLARTESPEEAAP